MINFPTVIITVFLGILIFLIPRRYILLPFILCACFVPADQRIIILDLDFTPLRMLVVAGFLRTIMLGEKRTFKWNRFDKLVLAWSFCGAIIYVIQWADMRALIYMCGMLFDIIGLYWIFRISVTSWSDIKIATKIFAACSLVLAVLVGYEWATGKNPFVAFGTVRTVVRMGRYRCQSSFEHPIILGLFWATMVPLFIGFARQGKHKLLLWSGVAASIFIVAATASSTPVLTLLIVLIITCGYKWRQYTATAGWGILATLVALHIVMKAPVWHLLSRMSVVPGSTGWFRYNIIDQAIKHFDEWAFLGCRSTAHWGWLMWDVVNGYVGVAVQGGLITLVLFLVLLYTALKILLRMSFKYPERKQQFLAWCLFTIMSGHCVALFGVPYFGQMRMWWFMTLAMVSFLSESKVSSKILCRCPMTISTCEDDIIFGAKNSDDS